MTTHSIKTNLSRSIYLSWYSTTEALCWVEIHPDGWIKTFLQDFRNCYWICHFLKNKHAWPLHLRWDDTTLFGTNKSYFCVQSVWAKHTQSEAGRSMNREYFENKLNGLITNKYTYKNTLIVIFHYQKKKKFIKDTKGTQLNPPWQSRITNRQKRKNQIKPKLWR